MTPTWVLCHGTQVVAIHTHGQVICPLCGHTFTSTRPVTRKEGR